MSDKTFLQWPFFDDAHRDYAGKIDAWVSESIAPLAEHEPETIVEVDTQSKAFVSALGAGGWLKNCVPSAYGGNIEKLDVRTLCLTRETLARTSGLADFAFAMQGLGSAPVTLFGTDEQKQLLLPKVATGEALPAFALSEPASGSDVAALSVSAKRDGEDYVINGEKTWISNGNIADYYVVFARTGEAPGARGLSAFLVEGDNPGLDASERIKVIAPHPLSRVKFTDCRVPATAMVGGPGDGFKVAMSTLDVFRSTVGAAALGFARRALDEAIAWATNREAFGSTLSEFQLIQAKIADMAVKVDAAALLVYRAAWTRDTVADRVTREAAMAKLYATDAAQEVIDDAVQIFGGMGVVSGVPVEQLYREIRALRIYEGTSEIQKLVIAGQAIKAAQEG
ncbi:MAG: acyl-CoA dehydrogenase family protein [Proteobacteria bacterium]|nr:acyl-CoA dehydrogenase family protein [Pseudomonadota bacterium]